MDTHAKKKIEALQQELAALKEQRREELEHFRSNATLGCRGYASLAIARLSERETTLDDTFADLLRSRLSGFGVECGHVAFENGSFHIWTSEAQKNFLNS